MEFKYTSRKDDMISLFYMMIYILNGNAFPGMDTFMKALKSSETIQIFKLVKRYKS